MDISIFIHCRWISQMYISSGKFLGVWFWIVAFRQNWWINHITVACYRWALQGLTWDKLLRSSSLSYWAIKGLLLFQIISGKFFSVISRIRKESEWQKLSEASMSIKALGFQKFLGYACGDHAVKFQFALSMDVQFVCDERRYTFSQVWNLCSMKWVSQILPSSLMNSLSKTVCF